MSRKPTAPLVPRSGIDMASTTLRVADELGSAADGRRRGPKEEVHPDARHCEASRKEGGQEFGYLTHRWSLKNDAALSLGGRAVVYGVFSTIWLSASGGTGETPSHVALFLVNRAGFRGGSSIRWTLYWTVFC
jgi:hypothetical protein